MQNLWETRAGFTDGGHFFRKKKKGARTFSSARKKGKTFFLKKLKRAEIFSHKNGGLQICSVCLIQTQLITAGLPGVIFFSYFYFISTSKMYKVYKKGLILESVSF